MSMRIRTVNGIRVALCAAETDPEPGDVYLNDADDRAIRIKITRDWKQESKELDDPASLLDIEYPNEWTVMDTQKKRDAAEELLKWNEKLKNEHGEE